MLPCEILELIVRKTGTRELLILVASKEFRYCVLAELKSRKLDFIEKRQKECKKQVLKQLLALYGPRYNVLRIMSGMAGMAYSS